MEILAYLVLAIYTLALLYITVYCVMQFHLLYHYLKERKADLVAAPRYAKQQEPSLVLAGGSDYDVLPDEESEDWPMVTIQLPIYNEFYVIERLIDAVAAFDYPHDRMEIHVLDDSTDETVEVVAAAVERWQQEGITIEHIRRDNRQGFKAGALRDAMPLANGAFIAIFDADFLPDPQFLRKTIPHFEEERVGVVQTRWEHINEDYSLITRLQAMQLNVHFTVEQTGRMQGDYMLQFNGTAGVWRRETIEDAGGWEADTLTEDLDLSIRAQLRGWRIQYLEAVTSPAELPVEMNSLKSQQFRWMKGGAETARKMLPTIWRSDLTRRQKIHATTHLMSSTVFLFVFVCGVMSVPLLFFLSILIEDGFSKNFFAYFLVGLLSVMAIYYVANVQATHQDEPFAHSVLKFVLLFPLFLALSMGLSLHNTVAVIQGWMGKKSPFVRTPKFNIKNISDHFKKQKYLNGRLTWTTIGEGLLALYFLLGIAGGFYVQNTTFLFFHLLLFIGYTTIFYFTLRHLRLN